MSRACVRKSVFWAWVVCLGVPAHAGLECASAFAGPSAWKGRDVVFLGDSITDKCHVGCQTNYWGFLSERLGFTAQVYGINGRQTDDIPRQIAHAQSECGDKVDAVFMLIGTNDYNAGVPLGDVFAFSEETVDKDGRQVLLKKREPSCDGKTFRGRLNAAFRAIKTAYPAAQVVVLTPLHRGFAQFGPKNVQPDERYANARGLFIDAYVQCVREAAALWSSPVIDLYAEAGLLPNEPAYNAYFARGGAGDSLHPSTRGHERLARVIEARLSAIPSTFR